MHLQQLFNIHPLNEWQFRAQQALTSVPLLGGMYGNIMRGLSEWERNRNTRSTFGIGFSDVKYPWLSTLYGSSVPSAVASMTPQVSNNIAELYGQNDEEEKLKQALFQRWYSAQFKR